jgi:hypothetical protein
MRSARQNERRIGGNMSYTHSWKAMFDDYSNRLKQQTGEDLATWNARILDQAPDEESGVRAWLDERGIHGYLQMLLVMERFGYPDYLQTPDDELIDNQFLDRPHLRPIFDRLIEIVMTNHPEAEIAGRKTYIPLFTPRRQFAVIKPTTRKRVDLGLRLDGASSDDRLIQAKNLGNETINLRIALESVEQIDDEVIAAIQRAWDANM